MNPKTCDALERKLRQRRERLWEEAMAADSELEYLAESRESEIVEAAQLERATALMARLDLRAKHEIEEIDAALARVAAGRYGTCARCERAIATKRLRALPETRLCHRCASLRPEPPRAEESHYVPLAEPPGPEK